MNFKVQNNICNYLRNAQSAANNATNKNSLVRMYSFIPRNNNNAFRVKSAKTK